MRDMRLMSAVIIAAVGALMLGYAGWVYGKSPHVEDFYQLIYPHAVRHRGASTESFVFGFPLAACVAAGMFCKALFTDRDLPASRLVWLAMGTTFFALVSLARLQDVQVTLGF